MRQDIERLNATINNVLNAAMYTDRPVADPQPLDLAKLARRAIDLTRTRHQLPPEAIRYEGAAGAARGAATRRRSRPRVLNLLDNAVKYSKDARARSRSRCGATPTARPTCGCATTASA